MADAAKKRNKGDNDNSVLNVLKRGFMSEEEAKADMQERYGNQLAEDKKLSAEERVQKFRKGFNGR